MLPEIGGRVREWLARREVAARPLTLGLKSVTPPPEYYERNGFRRMAEAISGMSPSWSGERVSLDTALNHSVFFTCKRIIAESAGLLPLNMMRRKGQE